MLAYIDAPHFYCGIIVENGVVTTAAPIVKYMMGWRQDQVRDYCAKKNWKVAFVKRPPPPE